MQENYIVNQEFTFGEYLTIIYLQTFRMKIVRRLFIFLTILGLLSAILNSDIIPDKKVVWYIVVGKFLLPPLFLFLFVIVFGALIAFLLMKLKPTLFAKATLTFTHWGMERTGETTKYSAPWSKFLKYNETSKYFFLFITDNESHVVQKRMFESNDQLAQFRQFIKERISS